MLLNSCFLSGVNYIEEDKHQVQELILNDTFPDKTHTVYGRRPATITSTAFSAAVLGNTCKTSGDSVFTVGQNQVKRVHHVIACKHAN